MKMLALFLLFIMFNLHAQDVKKVGVTSVASMFVDCASSLLIKFQPDIIFSFGCLVPDRDYGRETDSAFGTNTKLNGLFLLAGLKEKNETFDLNFTIVSSHLGSGKWREQLIGKIGKDYYFKSTGV